MDENPKDSEFSPIQGVRDGASGSVRAVANLHATDRSDTIIYKKTVCIILPSYHPANRFRPKKCDQATSDHNGSNYQYVNFGIRAISTVIF